MSRLLLQNYINIYYLRYFNIVQTSWYTFKAFKHNIIYLIFRFKKSDYLKMLQRPSYSIYVFNNYYSEFYRLDVLVYK